MAEDWWLERDDKPLSKVLRDGSVALIITPVNSCTEAGLATGFFLPAI